MSESTPLDPTENILIIGNGFDLYHGLPTKYSHFLDFIKNWNLFYIEYNRLRDSDNSTTIPKYIELKDYTINENNMKQLAEFYNMYNYDNIEKFNNLIKNNSWIDYFVETNYSHSPNFKEKGWIDFETEIEEVILYIRQVILSTDNGIRPTNVKSPTFKEEMCNFDKYIENGNYYVGDHHRVVSNYKIGNSVNTSQLLDDLKKELDDLILSLNIYLSEFVNNMKEIKSSEDISNLQISKIISFNYTNTYNKIYGCDKNNTDIHHLHGEINKNNLVLGMNDDNIDESELDYVYFFKYFQRIQKKTGVLYKKWINQSENKYNNFFVFGHSLDISDKDILNEIITASDTLQVTIFYRHQSEMEKFIINLIKILGKDNMIKYTSEEVIIFKELDSINI